MLSKRLAVVELAMPGSTSSLHLAFPYVPRLRFLVRQIGYIGNVEDSKVYPAAIEFSKIFHRKVASLGQCFHHGNIILTVF
jgi:hypothetical protein